MNSLILFFISSFLFSSLSFANDFAKNLRELEIKDTRSKVKFSMRGMSYDQKRLDLVAARTEKSKQTATFFMTVAGLVALLLFLIGDRFKSKTVLVGKYPEFDLDDKMFYRALKNYFKDDSKTPEIKDERISSNIEGRFKKKPNTNPEKRL